MTELRWEIPSSWAWASMDEVSEIVGGGTPSAKDGSNFADEGIRWLTPADLTGYRETFISRGRRDLSEKGYRSSAARILPAGTVLFSSRAPIGYCAIASGEISTNQGFKSFVLKGKISPEYIRHYLLASVDYAESKASGTTFMELSGSRAAELSAPIAPLSEQRRIVAKIDSLTGKSRRARDHLDHIPRLVEKYKQAILAAAFRGDLTREWREGRSLAATRSVLLGEVAEGFNYGSAAKSAKQGRVPVLRMGNIQDGKLDWADLVFTDDAAEIAKYRLKNGDVLFNRTNSPALVGKTALFTGKREAIYAGYLIKVRCKPQLLPAFLTYCLNAPNGRAYSWEVKTDGVSQSNINAKKLAAFRFDLPSVQEQEEIVRRIERALSWINRVTVDATSARKLIDYLDNSVLAKAFRGELVPQDPADEPASALLDRIREERAAAPKAKRGRKKAA